MATRLLTIPEVAAALGRSRSSVYSLLQHGELPSVRLGSSRRVREADLDAFVGSLDDGGYAAEHASF